MIILRKTIIKFMTSLGKKYLKEIPSDFEYLLEKFLKEYFSKHNINFKEGD